MDNMKMKENMRRLYLYNRANGNETVTYIAESVMTALNGQIKDFSDIAEYMTPPSRKAALNRLNACEHNPPEIEVTHRHHSMMGWEAIR
jgi:hypothetical protein